MKVEMKVNLGSRDAARFQLDCTKCTEGAVVDMSDDAGNWLIGNGWALPQSIEAVPPAQSPPKPTPPLKGIRESMKGDKGK